MNALLVAIAVWAGAVVFATIVAATTVALLREVLRR